jgi:hypothetical protein
MDCRKRRFGRHRHCSGTHGCKDEIEVYEAEEEIYRLAYMSIGYIDTPRIALRHLYSVYYT